MVPVLSGQDAVIMTIITLGHDQLPVVNRSSKSL